MSMSSKVLSVLCAAGAVAMVGGIRADAIAALAPQSGVRLHTGSDFLGMSLLFPPKSTYYATLQPEYKNTISSLHVPQGFEVTLIDCDGDRSRSFNAGDHQFVGRSMNNRADIVIVSEKSAR